MGEPSFGGLGEDLTGRKVAISSGFLDEVAAFEAEGLTK
jgi:hypothetical protein